MWNDTAMPERSDQAGTDALTRLVGERVRALRGARGLSLSALAARAGLGKATLSGIESGRRNATLETLYAIAAELGVGLSALVGGPEPGGTAVVRGAAVEARLVAAYRDSEATTEIFRLRISPERVQISPDHGPGVVEHLLVTAGTVRVGPLDAPVTVSAGEDWTWQPSGPHGYVAVGGPAEAVLVMRHPAAAR
jgi:transcriptional regulator with XRE-family HTH domain